MDNGMTVTVTHASNHVMDIFFFTNVVTPQCRFLSVCYYLEYGRTYQQRSTWAIADLERKSQGYLFDIIVARAPSVCSD